MGAQVDNMNRGGMGGRQLWISQQSGKRGKLPLNEQTLGHPATLIVMVTCRLVAAPAAGRDDK